MAADDVRCFLIDATTLPFMSCFYPNDDVMDYPRIQILTVEDLLAGKGIDMPPSAYGTFKQAEKVKKQEGKQGELPM